MNYKMMGKFISQILAVEAVFMLPALLISAFAGEFAAAWAFVVTVALSWQWRGCCMPCAAAAGGCSAPGRVW